MNFAETFVFGVAASTLLVPLLFKKYFEVLSFLIAFRILNLFLESYFGFPDISNLVSAAIVILVIASCLFSPSQIHHLGVYSLIIIFSLFLIFSYLRYGEFARLFGETTKILLPLIGLLYLKSPASSGGKWLPYFVLGISCLDQITQGAGLDRAKGVFSHPNSAGFFFAVSSIFIFSQLSQNFSKRLLVLFGASLLSILWTLSIGAIAAACGGLVYLGRKRIYSRYKTTALKGRFLAFSSLIVFAFIALSRQKEIFQSLDLTASFSGANQTSAGWRLYSWYSVLREWLISDSLFGFGIGATSGPVQPVGNLVHNEYVRILTELGIIGVGLTGAIVRKMFKERLTDQDLSNDTFALIKAFIIALAINSLWSNAFNYSEANLMIVLCIIFATARPNKYEKAENVKTHNSSSNKY